MHPAVNEIRQGLTAAADASKAGPMAAYLKTDMPFYGVQTPQRRRIVKAALMAHPVASRSEYRDVVASLWELPHREEKYCAISIATRFQEYVTPGSMPLYKKMIVEGAWWDLVDGLASDAVGSVLLRHRAKTTVTMRRWVDGPDMWLRRTAILSQLRHRDQTDAAMLFDFCLRRAYEKEFFIRKAIGWALREYAKTDGDAVYDYCDRNGDQLSGLSLREATKHR
ncbi:MAG: DNA alkylation repair protein [Acidimicrobiia bacterium]|nr:DNA alkylation repair protein [Acidimicrobiia bacterium]